MFTATVCRSVLFLALISATLSGAALNEVAPPLAAPAPLPTSRATVLLPVPIPTPTEQLFVAAPLPPHPCRDVRAAEHLLTCLQSLEKDPAAPRGYVPKVSDFFCATMRRNNWHARINNSDLSAQATRTLDNARVFLALNPGQQNPIIATNLCSQNIEIAFYRGSSNIIPGRFRFDRIPKTVKEIYDGAGAQCLRCHRPEQDEWIVTRRYPLRPGVFKAPGEDSAEGKTGGGLTGEGKAGEPLLEARAELADAPIETQDAADYKDRNVATVDVPLTDAEYDELLKRRFGATVIADGKPIDVLRMVYINWDGGYRRMSSPKDPNDEDIALNATTREPITFNTKMHSTVYFNNIRSGANADFEARARQVLDRLKNGSSVKGCDAEEARRRLQVLLEGTDCKMSWER